MPHITDNKESKHSSSSKVLGALAAGSLELAIFHPLDTFSRRLQNNHTKVFVPSQPVASFQRIWNVAIATGNPYAGISVGFGDKIFKRVYKFGGQKILVDSVLTPYCSDTFKTTFGEKHARPMLEATAGSLIGMFEVVGLPLDNIKINKQINPKAYGDKNIFQIINRHNYKTFYSGAMTTVTRNAPGSFLLFGGSDACYEFYYNLDNRKHATPIQNFVASATGAASSVIGTLPLDVIKTRIQAASSKAESKKISGMEMGKKIFTEEGVTAFFKASTTKTTMSIAKVAFGLTLAKEATRIIDKKMKA